MKKIAMFALIMILCSAFAMAACPEGMVSYWKFDDGSGLNALDSFDGNNGTLINGPVWNSSGQVNGALQFDGSNDYVNVPNITLNKNQTTFMAWVNLTDYADWRDLVKNTNNGAQGQYYIFVNKNDGKLWVNLANVPGGLSNGVIPMGVWTHVACTYDGSSIKIYFNGVLDSSFSRSNTNFNFTGINIGVQSAGTSEFFKGKLDEIAVFNRSLNSSEIMDLYLLGNNTHTGYCGPSNQNESVPEVDGNPKFLTFLLIVAVIAVIGVIFFKKE